MVYPFSLPLTENSKRNTMKKKAYEILETLQTVIQSEEFKNKHRASREDFTRSCVFKFGVLFLPILNLMRKTLQVELNNSLGKILFLPVVTKQAFSSARKKLLPTAFVDLNETLIQEIYLDREFKTFQGYRLVVVDGSSLELPEGESLEAKYGTCSNQSEKKRNTAQISYAYDPLNGIVLSALLKPYGTCERSMACEHVLTIPFNCAELYLLDRGYPSIFLIFFLLFHKKDFVMRCSTAWIAIVQKAFKSGQKDVTIEITPKMLNGEQRKEFQKQLPEVPLNASAKIRVVIIELSTGEKEILITSLLDRKEFEYEIFKDLYHQRWDGEENYKFHKVRIEIENFSGKTSRAIEQDFHATVLIANIRALLAEEAQEERDQKDRSKNKYIYIINQNIGVGTLKDDMMKALFDPTTDLKAFCEQIKKTMKRSVVPIRPERQFPRTRKTNRRFPMNARRSI